MNSSSLMACPALPAISPPLPGFGYQSLCICLFASVIAASKRARQLVDGAPALVEDMEDEKPLSIAVEELYEGKVKILGEGPDEG